MLGNYRLRRNIGSGELENVRLLRAIGSRE